MVMVAPPLKRCRVCEMVPRCPKAASQLAGVLRLVAAKKAGRGMKSKLRASLLAVLSPNQPLSKEVQLQ